MNCEEVNAKLEAINKKFEEAIEAFGRQGKEAADKLEVQIGNVFRTTNEQNATILEHAEEIDKLNQKCLARNRRRKKTDTKLKEEIEESVKETNKLKLRMAQVATIQGHQGEEIQEHSEELQGHDVRITDLEKPTGNILLGEVMMKLFLRDEFSNEFLTRIPETEEEAKSYVKECRDKIAAYYYNVDLPWYDSDTRHFDAFRLQLGGLYYLVDFMEGHESLDPIVAKWCFNKRLWDDEIDGKF